MVHSPETWKAAEHSVPNLAYHSVIGFLRQAEAFFHVLETGVAASVLNTSQGWCKTARIGIEPLRPCKPN